MKIKPRSLYAFDKIRQGEFILFLKEENGIWEFMQLPDRHHLKFIQTDIKKAINTKTVVFVEQIPEDVFEVCVANLEKKS